MTTPTQHYSIIFAGVGGQGVLSLAQLTLEAARREGYYILQSEIHGMSQRGGMVNSHVQFSKTPVSSPIITQGTAQMIVATEPLESLRYVSYLNAQGVIISTKSQLKNFAGYPELDFLMKKMEKLPTRLIDTDPLLQQIGFKQGLGTILLGIASQRLPIQKSTWQTVITDLFLPKGQSVVDKNWKAFELGSSL
ncbi:MAG: indolepyruvate oxidoreductase [Oligoflexia bacterium]|nr:MAG: indolepyruvate oxidoreductase [Oligoflexia bacterium]